MDAFDIVILGFDRSRPDSPAAGLQRIFPIDQGTAVRLINALPATVKRGVPRVSAEQYQAALVAIGARVELRIAAPKPASAALATPAPVPVAAMSRFAGAATLKQGSLADSIVPPTDVAFVSSPAFARSSPPEPALVPPPAPATSDATLPDAVPPGVELPASEQWGGLGSVEASKPNVAGDSLPAPAGPDGAPDEREEARRELFRRLKDHTGSIGMSAAEAAGGISMLDLDLPPPRADWADTQDADTAPESPISDHLDLAAPIPPMHQLASLRPQIQAFEAPRDTRSMLEALPGALALTLREGGFRWVLLMGVVGVVISLLISALHAHPTVSLVVEAAVAVLLMALASEQGMSTFRAVVDDLGSPDGPDLRGTDLGRYFSAGFNLVCIGFVTQLPFVVWLVRHREQLPEAFTQDPLGLLMFSVSAFYWPIAVGLQSVTEDPFAVWSVPRGFRVIFGALPDYIIVVLAAGLMAALPLGLGWLLLRVAMPAQGIWACIALALSMGHATIAALMGHLLRLHPTAFED